MSRLSTRSLLGSFITAWLIASVLLILVLISSAMVYAQVEFTQHAFIVLDKQGNQDFGNTVFDGSRYVYVAGTDGDYGFIAKIDLSKVITNSEESLVWFKEYSAGYTVSMKINNILYREEGGVGYLYIVGSLTSNYESDAFVAKIKASDGGIVWFKAIGYYDSMSENAYTIVYASDTGDLYVIGDVNTNTNPTLYPTTGVDVFIARVNPNTGDVEGLWRFYTTADDYIGALGSYVRRVFYDSNQHALYITGSTNFHADTSRWDTDVFVARINFTNPDNPTLTWYKQFGSTLRDTGYSLLVSGGYVYVDGMYSNSSSAYSALIAKLYASNGGIVWVMFFNETGNTPAIDLEYYGGKLWLTGSTDVWGAGSRDIYIAEVDPNTGLAIKLYTIGGSLQDYGDALTTINAANGVFLGLSGTTKSYTTTPNTYNVFLAIFSPSINKKLLWPKNLGWSSVEVSTHKVTSAAATIGYENPQVNITDAQKLMPEKDLTSSITVEDSTGNVQIYVAKDTPPKTGGGGGFFLGGSLCFNEARIFGIALMTTIIALILYTMLFLRRKYS